MDLLNMLKSVSVVEWAFWIVVTVFSVKGYIEYPNIIRKNLEKSKKAYNGKPSFQA